MKVLMINGSPHERGTTYIALSEMVGVFEKEGIECEIVNVGGLTVSGCKTCGACKKLARCAIPDIVNQIAEKFAAADALVVGSPVYYASPNATLLAVLDRLFYSTRFDKRMKVGCAVVAARRGGLTSSFDVINKYFAISGMPIATGQYWNGLHGGADAEATRTDLEGLQSMRTLAYNAAFLMKAIALAKEQLPPPTSEPKVRTSFIR